MERERYKNKNIKLKHKILRAERDNKEREGVRIVEEIAGARMERVRLEEEVTTIRMEREVRRVKLDEEITKMRIERVKLEGDVLARGRDNKGVEGVRLEREADKIMMEARVLARRMLIELPRGRG